MNMNPENARTRKVDANVVAREAPRGTPPYRPADASLRTAYYERIRNRRAGHPAEAWFGGTSDANGQEAAPRRSGRGCWMRVRRAIANLF